MPSTSTYHHGNLRATLVDHATDLARRGGPEAVVLREVARQAGVSHNAAYRHFADRDELLGEVAHRAMAELETAMRTRMESILTDDAVERARLHLRVTGTAYVEFALAEPGLFRVAFARAFGQGEEPTEEGPYALLNGVLDEMVRVGGLAPARRPGATVACWSAVHGFAVLHLDGPLRDIAATERDASLAAMLDAIEAALAATT